MALLEREEEDPNDFKEVKVDLNSLDAVPFVFEFKKFESIFPFDDMVEASGGNLPVFTQGAYVIVSRNRLF